MCCMLQDVKKGKMFLVLVMFHMGTRNRAVVLFCLGNKVLDGSHLFLKLLTANCHRPYQSRSTKKRKEKREMLDDVYYCIKIDFSIKNCIVIQIQQKELQSKALGIVVK